jgi:hypothetical protein
VILGHFGIASAARRASRTYMGATMLVALLAASVAPDILDVIYAATGFCNPFGLYSHTIHAVVLEAAVIGGLAWLATGSRVVTLTFVAVVLLHVPADLLTGRKLLVPGGELYGLRLYDQPAIDWLLEAPIAVWGWWILRGDERVPRWVRSAWVALALVAVQSGFDVYAHIHHAGFKPSACGRMSAAAGKPPLVTGD